MVQNSFQNRTTNSFQSVTRMWATGLPSVCADAVGGEELGKVVQVHYSAVTVSSLSIVQLCV